MGRNLFKYLAESEYLWTMEKLKELNNLKVFKGDD